MQYVLTILLTGVVLYFTSILWCRGIIVSFNAKSGINMQYQVYYTNKVGQDFSEKHSVKKKVLEGTHKVTIALPTSKIVKFRLAFGSQPRDIDISDLQIKGNDAISLNYREFEENDIEYYLAKENGFLLVSYLDNPYLTYKNELNISRSNRVDWYRLLSIFFLAFFLMREFVKYLLEKQYSRVDVIMSTAFFALLFVPMLDISDAKKSDTELRMLAEKPRLMAYDEEGDSFGKRFDAWYNDHFFGRDDMIRLYNKIKQINNVWINRIICYDKKSKWMFNKASYEEKLTKEQKEKIFNSLEKIADFARFNKIKFYLFVVPHKTDIYLKFHPFYAVSQHRSYGDFIDYLKKNASFPVIFPSDELKEASKEDYVFFKRTHHWTEWGAYNGYKSLIKEIRKDFRDVPLADESLYKIHYEHGVRDDWERRFKNNDVIMDTNISDDDKYKYYDVNYFIDMVVIDEELNKIKEFYNANSINNLKVILTGTSNNENLLQFLPYSFKEVKYLRFNTVKGVSAEDEYKLMKRYRYYIVSYKPDILILSVIADIIPDLTNLTEGDL